MIGSVCITRKAKSKTYAAASQRELTENPLKNVETGCRDISQQDIETYALLNAPDPPYIYDLCESCTGKLSTQMFVVLSNYVDQFLF